MRDINFEKLGFQYIGKFSKIGNEKTKLRKFKCFYGATLKLINIIWKKLLINGWFNFAPRKKVKPVHLLMGLYFLKCYNIEEINASFFNCDEKTFRQWSWYIVKGIASLDKKIVSFLFRIDFLFIAY